MIEREDRLSPEEAEVSAALSRLRIDDMPPATLDAAILASARHAVDAGSAAASAAPGAPLTLRPSHRASHAQRRRPRARMATGMGIAASVLLAAGLAWQLRPLPEDDIAWSEAPMAAAAMQETPAEAAATAERADMAAAAPPQPALPARDGAAESNKAGSAQAPAGSARKAGAPAPSAEPDETIETDTSREATAIPRAEQMPAPPPPAPAPVAVRDAPPAAPASSSAAFGRAPLPAPVAAEPQASQREAAMRAASAADGARAERRRSASQADSDHARRLPATADVAVFDQPYDDQPPASLDSPDVRRAWLARIAELMESEQYEAARASLAEFQRRYPDDVVPPELSPLQD